MATARIPNQKSFDQVVETHKPKNFKYYYYFHNPDDLVELEKSGYDVLSLDTIQNPDLIDAAKSTQYTYYERDIVAHAKEPVMLERGVLMTKKMITKADKKLLKVGVGFFSRNNVDYVSIQFRYERFDIYEIFILS